MYFEGTETDNGTLMLSMRSREFQVWRIEQSVPERDAGSKAWFRQSQRRTSKVGLLGSGVPAGIRMSHSFRRAIFDRYVGQRDDFRF